jgi:hypothetical protein
MLRITMIVRTCHRGEPKLGDLTIAFDVNMRRFAPIGTEEDETVWAVAEDRRYNVAKLINYGRQGARRLL